MKTAILSLSIILLAMARAALADPTLTIDVRDASLAEADAILRPGVVAYGLGYDDGFGGDPNLETLQQYLDATSSSNGDVIITTLSVQLSKLTTLTGGPEFDAELDNLLSGEIQDIVDAVNARQAGGSRPDEDLLFAS